MTPYLDVQNITKSFGAQVLFRNISFSVGEGQKVGLIAKNGTGKSTLLEILAGKEGYDDGQIIYRNDIRIGFLEQTPKFDAEESVLDACFNHEGNPDKILRAKQILTQLHITDLDQPMGQLSGGQQKRVALANALLNEPDFLILDEPTNHMDIIGKETLEKLLMDFSGTVIVVSHDRYLINRVAKSLIVFENGGVRYFDGTFDEYEEREKETAEEVAKEKPEKTKKTGGERYVESKEEARRKHRVEFLEKKITALEEELSRAQANSTTKPSTPTTKK